MKDTLTVVIPCKNEGLMIYDCVKKLSHQEGCDGMKVIIADITDDDKLKPTNLISMYPSLDIEIIKGGYPAAARLAGSRLVKTPFMLFLDADVMVRDLTLLSAMIECMVCNKAQYELLTVRYQTDDIHYEWFFRGSDLMQSFGLFIGTVFAIGGFQLWRTESYWKHGGYNAEQMVCEDFFLSQKVPKKKFCIYKTYGVFTSARRIEKNGIWYFLWLSLQCYLNRNNPEWFKSTHNYW